MDLIKKSSQLGTLIVFSIALWFLVWELFMEHKEQWILLVEKSEIQFTQGKYSSEQDCEAAMVILPGEVTECRRVDGPYAVLNKVLDVVFPF